MNGKFIIIMFVVINIVTLVISGACEQEGGSCAEDTRQNIMVNFLNIDDINITSTGGPSLNSTFNSTIQDLTREESSGIKEDTGISALIDGLKMVTAFIALLTPIPMLTFAYSLNMPTWLTILFAFPLFFLWIIAIAEFIRGNAL